jgi:ABC-type polysaccharide/polyol phosphate transport system ATPase subunit
MHSPTSLDQQSDVRATAPVDPSTRRVVIEARDVRKVFAIPEHRVDSLKERAVHPFTRSETRELHALRGVSFDVHEGEFFGIVGRNGSGKSTLLKILASIYQADGGSVRMAGRLAPFIELGVGFNPELTARENGLLNGVLLGLTKREARRRLDAMIEFAELEDFVDLKLKNYSSGMMVRLAFAIMVQADADIMLIDEVLAVGDAAFSQKCLDVFREKREAGKTIVLVTHDMTMVQDMCDRAMLLHDGDLKFVGAPDECAAKYYRLNFEVSRDQEGEDLDRQLHAVAENDAARLVRARLIDADGRTVTNVEQGAPLRLEVVLEAQRELVRPRFLMHGLTEDGTVVFEFALGFEGQAEDRLGQGERVRLAGEIENPLVPGRYMLNCWVRRDGDGVGMAVQAMRLLHFVVYGTATRYGLVRVTNDFVVEPQRRE